MTTEYFLSGNPVEMPANCAVNDSFTMGVTGMTSSPTGTCEYQRLANHVHVTIPAISGTSNATSFTLTGLPAAIRPAVAKNVPAVLLTNGGLNLMGSATVNTDGTVTLSAGTLGSLFSALLGKGIAKQEISWLL